MHLGHPPLPRQLSWAHPQPPSSWVSGEGRKRRPWASRKSTWNCLGQGVCPHPRRPLSAEFREWVSAPLPRSPQAAGGTSAHTCPPAQLLQRLPDPTFHHPGPRGLCGVGGAEAGAGLPAALSVAIGAEMSQRTSALLGDANNQQAKFGKSRASLRGTGAATYELWDTGLVTCRAQASGTKSLVRHGQGRGGQEAVGEPEGGTFWGTVNPTHWGLLRGTD